MSQGASLNESDPIEVYWMGFSRKDPHETDMAKLRSDLIWIEKKIAYGVSAAKNKSDPSQFDVHLVALPHMKPYLKISADGRPRVFGVIGSRQCYFLRVYVHAQENMIGLPKVLWVNIHGIDVATGEEIVEKIIP